MAVRRRLAPLAALAAALSAAPAADAVCRYVPPRSATEERIDAAILGRRALGFPSGRALVRRLDRDEAAGERSFDAFIDFPVTVRETRYLRDRTRVEGEAGDIGRIAERIRGLSGGVSIEDDYPRGAYVRLRVTRSPSARERRSLGRRARRLRLRRVETSERVLRRLQDRVSEDSAFQEAFGIEFQSAGFDSDRNQVEFEFSSERPDARALLRARYGRKVLLRQVPALTPGCDNPVSYRLEPDGRTLTVTWTTSGSARNHRVEVREAADLVLIGAVSDFPPTITADAAGVSASVTLAAPLGGRRVESIVTRRPVRRAQRGG